MKTLEIQYYAVEPNRVFPTWGVEEIVDALAMSTNYRLDVHLQGEHPPVEAYVSRNRLIRGTREFITETKGLDLNDPTRMLRLCTKMLEISAKSQNGLDHGSTLYEFVRAFIPPSGDSSFFDMLRHTFVADN